MIFSHQSLCTVLLIVGFARYFDGEKVERVWTGWAAVGNGVIINGKLMMYVDRHADNKRFTFSLYRRDARRGLLEAFQRQRGYSSSPTTRKEGHEIDEVEEIEMREREARSKTEKWSVLRQIGVR